MRLLDPAAETGRVLFIGNSDGTLSTAKAFSCEPEDGLLTVTKLSGFSADGTCMAITLWIVA